MYDGHVEVNVVDGDDEELRLAISRRATCPIPSIAEISRKDHPGTQVLTIPTTGLGIPPQSQSKVLPRIDASSVKRRTTSVRSDTTWYHSRHFRV